MEQELARISKSLEDLWEQFTQHRHTGVDTLKVLRDDLGGFVSRVGAYATADQSVGGSEVLVEYDAVDYDPGQEYSTTTFSFTAKTPGMYQVDAYIKYDAEALGITGTMGMILKKNGTDFFRVDYPATPEQLTVGISRVMKLAVGDILSVYAVQTTGQTKTILGGSENNSLTIRRLGK